MPAASKRKEADSASADVPRKLTPNGKNIEKMDTDGDEGMGEFQDPWEDEESEEEVVNDEDEGGLEHT